MGMLWICSSLCATGDRSFWDPLGSRTEQASGTCPAEEWENRSLYLLLLPPWPRSPVGVSTSLTSSVLCLCQQKVGSHKCPMLQRRPGTESQSCVGSLRSGRLRVYQSKAGFCSNGGVKGGLRGWKAKPSKHEIKALGPLPEKPVSLWPRAGPKMHQECLKRSLLGLDAELGSESPRLAPWSLALM